MTGKPKANHSFPVSRKLGKKKKRNLWLTAGMSFPEVPAAKFPAFSIPRGSRCRNVLGTEDAGVSSA